MNKPEIKIGNKAIGKNSLFFVIEEGQANWGDFHKALKMIDLAAEVGADAIEFQFAIASDFYVKDHEGLKIYESVQLPIEKMCGLVQYSKKRGLEFITAPLSYNLIEPLIKAGTSAFNINASDINNPQMLEYVSKSGLPFFISLPLADETEINWAIERVEKSNSNYVLLHGQHTMASGEHGVQVEHSSLGYVETIKRNFNGFSGYIDHSPYIWMPACAVAAGADVITKHLCISRDEKGPDWQVCLEPAEMKEAIIIARKMKASINVKEKVLAPGEHFDKSVMRRSIVAARQILKGEKLTLNEVNFKRPGDGLAPSQTLLIIGKNAIRDIQFDEQIKTDDVE
jgi:sialic acid synthase SpsE